MVSAAVASIFLICMLVERGSPSTCPTQTFTAKAGEFTSPGYPDSRYPNNQKCRYVIKAGAEYLIEITFNNFEIQSPSNGKRTDFVKIIDGLPKNPSQVVYYDGTRETPFTFVSTQRIIFIIFSANRRINKRGFNAIYRLFKDPVYCDYPFVLNGWGDCIEAEDEGYYSSCNITCDFGFQLNDGDMTLQCNTDTGNWTEPPSCSLIPEILELCAKDITNLDCIYAPDVITQYYLGEGSIVQTDEQLTALIEKLGDELDEFEEEEALPPNARARGILKAVKCKQFICQHNKITGQFLYHCPTTANAVQKARRLNAAQKKRWLQFCFRCQIHGCKFAYLP